MGLLVGLPLKLFHLLFILLRFIWPLLLFLLIRFLLRRRKDTGSFRHSNAKESDFKGPVVEVDYRVVEDEKPDSK